MPLQTDAAYFARTVDLAREALTRGDDGFASVLVGADGDILMEQGNMAVSWKDPTAHDSLLLASGAARKYSPEVLRESTMYALMEPCVMCMGAVFWSGIGAVKFAMSEKAMAGLLPGGLDFSSHEFAARSPRAIRVTGPFPEIVEAEEIVRTWIRSLGIPGLEV